MKLSNLQTDFLTYQAQTNSHPLLLQIKRASGCQIIDYKGKKYLDFIAGVSALPLGHNHPKVIKAIEKQLNRYMHVMVYGEFVQESSVKLCKLITANLPKSLNTTYLTNSGTEAMEGALKLAKRDTERSEFIAFENSYHGNTMGSMSVSGNEYSKQAYRPLIPGSYFLKYNDISQIDLISFKTAAVILETIQGGSGFLLPSKKFLDALQSKCKKTGTLLILDEIQPGFGRTGTLFAFEQYNLKPDILVVGKALGGGMPIGAFISNKIRMQKLTHNPHLGHITTFGGHPVVSTSAFATLKELLDSNILSQIKEKEQYFLSLLCHKNIENVRGKGLMIAIVLKKNLPTQEIIKNALSRGLLLFGFLFEKQAIRITPPLTISFDEIKQGCNIILSLLDEYK